MATKSFATSTVMDLVDFDQQSLLSMLIIGFHMMGGNRKADLMGCSCYWVDCV